MIEELKKVVSSDNFKSEINQHTRSSNKNRRSIVKYINALFDSKSRLLVVRVDLGYEARTKRNGGDVSYAQAKEHREEFFKELKKLFPNGGFGWLLLEVRVRYFQVLSLSCDGIFGWRKNEERMFR